MVAQQQVLSDVSQTRLYLSSTCNLRSLKTFSLGIRLFLWEQVTIFVETTSPNHG